MNILVVTQLYPEPDDVGGYKITHTVEYFCKEWIKAGYSVTVVHVPSRFPKLFYRFSFFAKKFFIRNTLRIIPSIESSKNLDYYNNGIHILRFPLLKYFPGAAYSKKRLKKFTSYLISVLEKNSFKPNVILGHFANPSTELVANLTDYYKCYSSIVFHHDCSNRNILKYRIKKNIKKIKAVGCRSLYEAKSIKHDLKLNNDPYICYSGFPSAFINQEKNDNKYCYTNGIKYLYVGGLVRTKNVDSIITAFSISQNPNDSLSIVGAGDDEKRLKKLVKRLNLDRQVTFCGRISREEVLKKMGESNVFVMISNNETYGMVYAEAMASGCLTIASLNGGFDGIIVDGQNGFLCEQGNHKMLANIFNNIKSMTEEKRMEIGNNATKIKSTLSDENVANNYLKEVIKRNEDI